jgi:hypothetical protein
MLLATCRIHHLAEYQEFSFVSCLGTHVPSIPLFSFLPVDS